MTNIPPSEDPIQARVARKYLQALREIQELGMPGFSVLIDSANEAELEDLETAADVILQNVARVKSLG